MSVSVGKPANWLLNMMKNPVFPLLVLVLISACATSTDKEYIRCLQGFNDPSTGSGIPVGKAASVMAAGTVGAAAALTLGAQVAQLAAVHVQGLEAEHQVHELVRVP